MIIVTLRMRVTAKRRETFLNSASLIAGPTKVQPGCISYGFFKSLDDPDTVLLVEEWESRESLEHHIKSDAYRIILSLMDLCNEPPEIKIDTISKTEGMEAIEAVISRK